MNAQRIGHFLKSNFFQLIAIAWATWLTWSIQTAREDINAVSSQVSILQDSISADDSEQELDDIKKTLSRIERRLPY